MSRVCVQFPLRLTWVSEIISPAKTDVDFGPVTDIFLRTWSELVRFVLSIFAIALWPGMNPRNFPRNPWRALHEREVISSLSTYTSSVVVLLQFFYNSLRFLCKISSVCNGKKKLNPIRNNRLFKNIYSLEGKVHYDWSIHIYFQISLPNFQFNLAIC